jgi:hypothetical protein
MLADECDTVRWYVPEDAMTNGSYVYPVVRNISQILA